MCRRRDTLKRKTAVSNGKAVMRSWFSSKRGYRGKNAEQGFAAVIAFVLRECVDFADTLKQECNTYIPVYDLILCKKETQSSSDSSQPLQTSTHPWLSAISNSSSQFRRIAELLLPQAG